MYFNAAASGRTPVDGLPWNYIETATLSPDDICDDGTYRDGPTLHRLIDEGGELLSQLTLTRDRRIATI